MLHNLLQVLYNNVYTCKLLSPILQFQYNRARYSTNTDQIINYIDEAVTDDSFPLPECLDDGATEWEVSQSPLQHAYTAVAS